MRAYWAIPVLASILVLSISFPLENAFAGTEDAKLTASDAAERDFFGTSVSISGDTAIVGARFNDDAGSSSGSAYIFVGSGTTWTEQAKLTASDAFANDQFGFSVSISGDTAIVGTPTDDDAGASSGSAYVFVRSGTTWTEQAKLTASDGAFLDEFGRSVSISGDTAIVGTLRGDDGVSGSGSAYVFVRSGTTWTEQAKLTASDAAANDFFGDSVSISGDTVMIGAHLDDDAGSSSGSAYVFVRSGTTWTEQAKITASDAFANDRFGISVSISGDSAIVGAPGDDDAGASSGSAYVFVRSGTTWTEQAKLTASDAAAGDAFGRGVSILGDAAIAGDDSVISSGAAYEFTRSGTTWTEQVKLTASDGAVDDRFGFSVSISGDIAIVGALLDDDAGSSSGSAYIFGTIVTPDNQPPVADANGPYLVAVNTPVNLDASASTDPDDGDTLSFGWSTTSSCTIDDASLANPQITCPETGIFDVTLEVTDSFGESDIDTTLIVVYDPTGGFVTGGGWIDSPAGAYTVDTSLTGKANFGFVSKYKMGANIPTGVTEFQFKVADLNFHSDSYEWLVVAGAKAMFKGVGTINGAGDFGFILSAIDEKLTPSTDTDLFRIKIVDKATDTLVYDNKVGETDDNANPTTPISGGSIIIHKAK